MTQPDTYNSLHSNFRWHVPDDFNMAQACCRRWAQDAPNSIAIRVHNTPANSLKPSVSHSYRQLFEAANRLSHVLTRLGVQRGDRVAIVMPQRFETAVAAMAVLQMGAVAVPLSMLFGPEALEYRLQDSGALVAICDESSVDNICAVRKKCKALRQVVGVGDAAEKAEIDYEFQTALMPTDFAAVPTLASDGAVLIYTSGTTGPPKGALIPHRALIGNLTGFVASQNWFGFDPAGPATAKSGVDCSAANRAAAARPAAARPAAAHGSQAVFWSPADWAWTGGLMDALLPTLYFGREIVAYNGRFSPDVAFEILQQHRVSHTFLFPTALKAMMKAYPQPRHHYTLCLQAIMSAGEAVGDAVFGYCRDALGVTVNEMFGQTEINYVVGNCSHLYQAKPNSMGRAYPGHQVAVIDDAGKICAVGVAGDVAVNRYDIHGHLDPVFFLGYWKNPAATAAKFTGDWCRTGDLATQDADGYLFYQGRSDDVFKAAGYRIGPSEVENCLVKHPAVANAAVVPKPDKERGAIVKAFIVLAPEFIAKRAMYSPANGLKRSEKLQEALRQHDAALIADIQSYVKGQLAPYEYPKEIEFIDALPMTTTGKVQRRVLRLQEEALAAAAAAATAAK